MCLSLNLILTIISTFLGITLFDLFVVDIDVVTKVDGSKNFEPLSKGLFVNKLMSFILA